MSFLQKSWQRITNNGLDDQALGKGVVKIRLLNQLIFLAFVTSTLALITDLVSNGNFWVRYASIANMCLEIMGIYFAYTRKHEITRFLSCWVFPTLVASHIIVLGGNFGETNIFTAFAFMNFILYEDNKRVQILIVVYTCALFILSKLYVIQNATESMVTKNPFDEIVTFPMVILILGLIILLYQNELKKYQKEQSRLIKSLEDNNKQLSQLNNELEEFTYIASHDLKTPLRTLSSHVGLARRHLSKNDFEAIKTDLNFIEKGAKQMYALITDILEYKMISHQNDTSEILDLNEIIAHTLIGLDSLLIEKSAIITVHELPNIYFRKQDMVILLQNMIENGIKYNESKQPQITINHQVNSEYLILSITDNGIGIDQAFHAKIFKFFKRLHTHERYQGTGIGLGLCKKIVTKYNGLLTVDSIENEGSSFKISLPKKYLRP